MWMVEPELLCRKHLLGEHSEIHKHRHNFVKRHRVTGRIFPIVLIEPLSMQTRHDELAKEMLQRGYNHQSPYEQPNVEHLPEEELNARVDIDVSLNELKNRCSECKNRIEKYAERK